MRREADTDTQSPAPGTGRFARFAAPAAFLLGAATVAGYAPFYLFALPVLTLAALIALVERSATPRAALRLGFWFGLGLFGAGVSWVYVSLNRFGGMPAPVAALSTAGFCAFLALFPAAVAWCVRRAAVAAPLRRLMLFPAVWVLAEWVRGWIFTGFPWLAVGYSQAPASPLVAIAPIAGVYGVGLAVAFSAGALLCAAQATRTAGLRALPKCPPLALALALWLVAAALATVEWTPPEGAPFKAALVQGNIAQDLKWREDQVRATLERYQRLVQSTDARLVVLPETALPMFLQDVPPDYLERLAAHARAQNGDILIGLPELAPGRAYFNSVVSRGASPPQVYRKVHLVPFGEFVPLRPLLAPIVAAMAIPLSDFSRGAADQRPLSVAGTRVALNICYEDVFGEEIIRQLPEAGVLVNVSNVAWFGDSAAPSQHAQMAQLRAIESGRPMLRATNTGLTALIDHRGAINASAPAFTTAVVSGEVQPRSGATPYVRFGNLPAIGICALLAAICALLAWRRTSATL